MEDWLKSLEQLYEEVDRTVAHLTQVHSGRLRCCRGCHSCCTDGIRVFEVEAEYIRRHNQTLLEQKAPYAGEGCAYFGEDGSCLIYAHRPYVWDAGFAPALDRGTPRGEGGGTPGYLPA